MRKIEKQMFGLTVNGQWYDLEIGSRPHEVDPSHTLAHTLRETLGLTGTKIGCDHGACGACTVLMDGKQVLSCMILTIETDGKCITTVEGLRDPKTGDLDPLQQAFIDHTAFQYGFCTPGILLAPRHSSMRILPPQKRRSREALAQELLSMYQPLSRSRCRMAAVKKGGSRNA
jgi:aerobic-type carbon monoxide dehydrogenase small subunit (CoxS/CutS family)